MKKQLFIFAAALALVGCSNNSYEGDLDPFQKATDDSSIVFSMYKSNNWAGAPMRRVGDKTGAEAADLLGNKFYVLGTKGTEETNSPSKTVVFDNYRVNWVENTAGTAASNTCDWDYVGVYKTDNPITGISSEAQTIKYWDYSVDQYDFIAYSVGHNTLVTGDASANNVKGTAIKTPVYDADDATKALSFTLTVASVEDLQECYFTDVTSVKKSATTGLVYGQPVQLKFKQLAAKVRVAFYETIPGYSVSDLEFYEAVPTTLSAQSNTDATLIGAGFATAGTIKVSYPKVGSGNRTDNAYNKAVATISSTGTDATYQKFGAVNYAGGKLGTTSTEASMAGTAAPYYYSAFPVSYANALTLCVNYTLTSEDGSGETIKVYGAKAVIDAAYCQWQPNYAYTYIFMISDNTNGYTATAAATPAGLFPITFDAVVAAVDDVDFNQETITTVATPSVTTYAFNGTDKKVIAAYGAGNEYPKATTTDIYVSVEGNKVLTGAKLYTITDGATEADVISELQLAGRNKIAMTVTTSLSILADAAGVKIPTEDGNGISVTSNTVAKFSADGTAKTYAFVLDVTTGTPTETYIYSAETLTAAPSDWTTAWYTDNTGTTPVSTWDDATHKGKTWYHKFTNNGHTYAVKVIKTY